MKPNKRVITRVIIRSLRETPENWDIGIHTAKHKKLPIEIWISNRYYGTRWQFGAIRSTHSDVVCFWWLNPWQWWRVDLIRAVEYAQLKQLPEGRI